MSMKHDPVQRMRESFARDLSEHYGVTDAVRFAGYVLDRCVRLDDLTRSEMREVLSEAKAARRPYEQKLISEQNSRYDHMTNAQMIAFGSALLH